MSYQFKMDLHTHTIVSGHAYSTMKEMAEMAAKRGLEVLGITEHAPQMPGSCEKIYFQNLLVVPRQRCGVELLLGVELNIVDYDGHVDLREQELKQMDIVIASMHQPCLPFGTLEENTRAYLKVMENPYVNIIGHPDDSRYPVDFKALVEAAGEHGKILELNNHSLGDVCYRQGARENDIEMLLLCKEYQVPIVVDSDAHVDLRVGDFTHAEALLEEVDFPEELVLNRSKEAIAPYLRRNFLH